MYYAKINWYNTIKEEDEISYAMIPAGDWNEAMLEITKAFEWINSIEMTEVSSEPCGLVFITEESIDSIIKENMIP